MQDQHNAAYNLTTYFFSSVIERIVNENQITSTVEYVMKLVSEGWTTDEIKNEVDGFKKEYPEMVRNVYTLEQIMSKKKPPNNLIEEGVFYYHNLLRITSQPTRIIKSSETGKMMRVEMPYFLEMIKTFTMDNLLAYWYKKSEQTPNESIIKKDKGRFNYLFGYYDLDEILFAIDIAQQNRKEMGHKPLRNAFDLERYIEEAKEEIKAKRSVSRINKVDQIIKKIDEG